MRAVVMVRTPAASVTQKVGVAHVALTDRDVLAGIVDALVYWTRMMSSLQTETFIRPGLSVKVTPVASTVKDAPVGGVVRVRLPAPPVPAVPFCPPPPAVLPPRPPLAAPAIPPAP